MKADFSPFYEAQFPSVYRAVFVACLDEEIALDATQEAFSRALLRWRKLRSHACPGGWVMTTAINEMRRLLRKRPPIAPDKDTQLDDLDEDVALHLDLVQVMRTLTPRQQMVALLFYWADLSTPAISELTGLSESGVRAHLANARRRMRRELEVVIDGA